MANAAAKVFMSYMESQDVNCSFMDDEETVIRAGWKLDGTRVSIFFHFGDDNSDVHIWGREFLTSIPESKYDQIFKICNELNSKYRWVKFWLDAEDGELVAEEDAVIQLDSCGEEAFELMIRMTQIIEEAYPMVMKELWA